MVKKFFKKKSKRVSTRTRTKIERKVREHNRKVRKESKKNPNPFKKKKAVEIPNDCPFKDDVLKDAERHKKRLEAEREKQKERRRKEREKARNKKRSLDSLVADAQRRGKEFERKNEFVADQSKATAGGKNVEMSLKQYYKEFKKVVDAADVILQVLDARDPLGSRCPQVEEAVLTAGTSKRLVLLLNKVDLVPQENVEAWLKHLRKEYPTIAFKCSTQTQSNNLSRSKVPLSLAADDLRKSSRCLGAELLLKLLGNYCRSRDIRTSITVGVVGFPNTGKSSVINSLKRSKVCNVGATPGVTRNMQAVQLDKHVQLLDSPGIVMASGSDAANVLKNCVRVEALEDPVPAVDAVLKRCTKQKLMMQYGISDFSDIQEFLALLARKQGCLKKGGIPDVLRAARTILQDWNQGRITYYTHPPEGDSPQAHLGAQIVSEMSKEFDIDSLLKEEAETLKELRQASTMDVVVETDGPTTGRIDGSDLMEEDEEQSPDEDSEAEASEAMDKDSEDEAMDSEKLYAVTVAANKLAAKKSKQSESSESEVKSKPKVNFEMTLEGNKQLNKSRKQDFKKMKKKRKRADVFAGELADVFEGAFDKLNAADDDDDYDFSTDFK